MSLINTQVPAFQATAYHKGKFVPVSQDNFKGKWSVVDDQQLKRVRKRGAFGVPHCRPGPGRAPPQPGLSSHAHSHASARAVIGVRRYTLPATAAPTSDAASP